MNAYPWYSKVDNNMEFQQGDFILDCPFIIPPIDFSKVKMAAVDVELVDSIILSQSCDLVNNKTQIVLVCAFYPLKDLLSIEQSIRGKKSLVEKLRKGTVPSYHLINKSDEVPFLSDYQVVDFKNLFGINLQALKQTVASMEERYRLLPPYREHLSQAFARYFMRVGLPQDLDMENYVY